MTPAVYDPQQPPAELLKALGGHGFNRVVHCVWLGGDKWVGVAIQAGQEALLETFIWTPERIWVGNDGYGCGATALLHALACMASI